MSKLAICADLTNLTTRVGRLATRAVRGEDLNTSAISDANTTLDVARDHIRNGDYDDAQEALQLAREQLDAAEHRNKFQNTKHASQRRFDR